MNGDSWHLEQLGPTAELLRVAAAHLALSRAKALAGGPPIRANLMEMYRVAALARRILHRLEAGQDALDRGDIAGASLEWAGARVLTDRLAAIANRPKLVHPRHHQKSGSVG